MALDLECQQKQEENFCPEEGQRAVKNFLLKKIKIMTKLESLKKSSHFARVLKHRVVSDDCFTIYRTKNFINKKKENKKLYISFVMRKKTGNAVKRNKIKRKLKAIVQKLLKINSAINLNYVYVIFGKEKAYKEYHDSLFAKMKKSFKRMDGVRL
tara:strand:- start:677 stop:1141 length:465 start_codon:yes stop_codon:yes gene_type:complete